MVKGLRVCWQDSVRANTTKSHRKTDQSALVEPETWVWLALSAKGSNHSSPNLKHNMGTVGWDLTILWQWYQIQNNTEMWGLQHLKSISGRQIQSFNVLTWHWLPVIHRPSLLSITEALKWTRHLVDVLLTKLHKDFNKKGNYSVREETWLIVQWLRVIRMFRCCPFNLF